MLKQSPGCSDSLAFILATWESDQYAVGDAMRITESGWGGENNTEWVQTDYPSDILSVNVYGIASPSKKQNQNNYTVEI